MGLLDWFFGNEEPLRRAAGTYTTPYDMPPRQAAGTVTAPYNPPLRQAAGTYTAPYDVPQRRAAGTVTAPYDRPMPPSGQTAPAGQPAAAPARGGFLSGFLGPEGRDMRQRLAIALEGMTLNPNQGLIETIRGDMEGRKADANRNRTIEWLRTLPGQNAQIAAQALEANSIDASTAVQYALQKEETSVNLTDDQREYAAAVAQGYTGTLMEFMTDMKRAGATSITTALPDAEKAYDKGMGEWAVKTYTTIQDQAAAASDQIGNLSYMESLMNDPNFISGTGTEAIISMRKLVEALGGNPADVGSIEAFRGATAQAVLGQMGGSLGAGFSNADRSFVESMAANLDNSVAGNRMIIEAQRKIARRKIELAQLADEYVARYGRLDGNWPKVMRAYGEANPLFGPPGSGGSDLSENAQRYLTLPGSN